MGVSKKNLLLCLFLILFSKVYSYDQSAYQDVLNGETNLAGKDLSEADLSKMDLSGINFEGANLNHINFDKSKITRCNFKGVSLAGATIKESILTDIDFSDAKLGGLTKETGRKKVVLKTNFSKSKLKNVKFENVKFENVAIIVMKKIQKKTFPGPLIAPVGKQGGTSFFECDMDGVVFSECDMDNLNFDKSTLRGIKITDCKLKKCSFKDVKLEGLLGGNITFYLENNRFDSCYFTDSTFKNKYKMYNMPKNIMLRTDGLSSRYIRMFKEKGAHIPSYSIIANADLHEDSEKNKKPYKRKLVKEMIKAAKNKKNNVIAAIYPGDLCDWGHKAEWKSFKKHYFNKLKGLVKKQFLCSGNHDRWRRDKTIGEHLGTLGRWVVGKKSYVTEKIKEQNGQKKDYYKYFMNGTDFVSLSECPTMPNNKPIDWFKDKIAKLKSPKILFYHYTPLTAWSVDWWTQKEEPRPTDRKRGKEAIDSFYKKIEEYKDKIMLQITGHQHESIYKRWKGIPTICVGGRDFALAHIDTQHPKKIGGKWKITSEVVAIEFIRPDRKRIYYPCLDSEVAI